MNAYEIADELRKHGLNGDNHGLFNKRIQNMLRQQANELDKVVPQLVKANGLIENLRLRIAELEETINACYTVQKMQAEEVYKGNDRIAELEKLLEHSVGSDCREMRYIQELENKDARIAELEKDLKKYDQLAWDDLNKSKTIWCACGDGITADSGAKCGICASTTQQTNDGCGNCHACLVGVMENGYPVTMQRMIVCPDCGNKRCPKASNHRHQCTGSNEPNQRGSIYTTPQTKPLSDEEILKQLEIVLGTEKFEFSNDPMWINFARAILRKAQEK